MVMKKEEDTVLLTKQKIISIADDLGDVLFDLEQSCILSKNQTDVVAEKLDGLMEKYIKV